MAWIKLEQAGNLEALNLSMLCEPGKTLPFPCGTSPGRQAGKAARRPSLGSSGLKNQIHEVRKFAERPFLVGDSLPTPK